MVGGSLVGSVLLLQRQMLPTAEQGTFPLVVNLSFIQLFSLETLDMTWELLGWLVPLRVLLARSSPCRREYTNDMVKFTYCCIYIRGVQDTDRRVTVWCIE